MSRQVIEIEERDHCRIGSLEMSRQVIEIEERDHCRIGSLEISYLTVFAGV